jgi:hypothetical protein
MGSHTICDSWLREQAMVNFKARWLESAPKKQTPAKARSDRDF